MPDTIIKIRNCNNIVNGDITICAEKLNILFGRNGTGKSSIARAVYLLSQGKELTELAPYGINCNNIVNGDITICADMAAVPYFAMERMGEQVVFRVKES